MSGLFHSNISIYFGEVRGVTSGTSLPLFVHFFCVEVFRTTLVAGSIKEFTHFRLNEKFLFDVKL